MVYTKLKKISITRNKERKKKEREEKMNMVSVCVVGSWVPVKLSQVTKKRARFVKRTILIFLVKNIPFLLSYWDSNLSSLT